MRHRLYLIRHAQSAERQPRQTDFDRELTAKGVQQSLQLARFFEIEKTFPQVVYSSPARRAKETTTLIIDVLKIENDAVYFHDELYEASVRTFFEFISSREDNFQQVMCVGHNPTISYLAEYLTKAEINEMAPAGMAIIEFNIDSWKEISEGNGELIKYVEVNI